MLSACTDGVTSTVNVTAHNQSKILFYDLHLKNIPKIKGTYVRDSQKYEMISFCWFSVFIFQWQIIVALCQKIVQGRSDNRMCLTVLHDKPANVNKQTC